MPRLVFIAPGRRRSGKVVVLVALCLAATIGVVAFALDGGVLQDDQHKLQAAADAAALAAAVDLYQNYLTNQGADLWGTAAQSAQTTAAANGFGNGTNGTTVTVNIPPRSGPFLGQAGYAEVIIQYNQARYFSNIFGSGTVPVQARAVARGMQKPYTYAGILLLDPKGKGAYNGSGGGVSVGEGTPVAVNSSHPEAVSLSGNAVLTGSQVNITGGKSTSGGAQILATVNTGVSPTPDPLAVLPVPNPSTLMLQSSSALEYSSGTYVLSPGVYVGGIALSGQAVANLQPGTYYLQGGGLNISGGASLIGDGVMIYNDPGRPDGAINVSGSGTLHLTPPTSGTYAGLTLFQDRSSDVKLSLSGGTGTSLIGTVYAASAPLKISGDADSIIGSQYVGYNLTVTGSSTFSVSWSPGSVVRQRDIRLVE